MKAFLLALAVVALSVSSPRAQDICDFPAGDVDWGGGADPCVVQPGQFDCSAGAGDGVCDPADSFRAQGEGAAASHVRVVDSFSLVGASSMLCVAGESSITLDAAAQNQPLRLDLPGGAQGATCGTGPTIQRQAFLVRDSADLTLQGGFVPISGSPSLVATPELLDAGDVVACAGDCVATPHRVRIEWACASGGSCANPAPPSLPAFVASVEGYAALGTTLLCFWDGDPATPEGPRDQGHCYSIKATQSTPPYRIEFDIRQRPPSGAFATSDLDDAPDSWRAPGATLLQASVQPGQRIIEVADGFVSPAHTLAGKFVRLEDDGNYLQESYVIQNSELGRCASQPEVSCSRDAQCVPFAAGTCDVSAPDRLVVLDVRGVQTDHDFTDPDESSVVVDLGHQRGDTFFVLAPVELTAGSPSPANWTVDDQELNVQGSTSETHVSVRGLLWHTLGSFHLESGTIDLWKHNLFWATETGKVVNFGNFLQVALPGGVIGHTEVVGGLSAEDETTWCTGQGTPHPCCSGAGVGSCLGYSHGIGFCADSSWVLEDFKVRYRGDDMANYCGHGFESNDSSLNRMRRFDARWMVPAVDVSASGNYLVHVGGSGRADLSAHSEIVDGICVSCVSGDSAGAVFGATSGGIPWMTTRYRNVALIETYGGIGASGRDVYRNMLIAGMRAFDAPPGWPHRRGSWSVLDGGTWVAGVVRENFTETGGLLGPQSPTAFTQCANVVTGTSSGENCATSTDCTVSGESCSVRLNAGHFSGLWVHDNAYLGGIDFGRARTNGVQQDLLGMCPFGPIGSTCPSTLHNSILADNYCGACATELADWNRCDVGSWDIENVTFAYTVDEQGDPLATPTHEGFVRVGSTPDCAYNNLAGLLFYGARSQPGSNHATYLPPAVFDCTGPSVGSTTDACPAPPGTAFCYENNDTDNLATMDPNQNIQYVQGVELGLADPTAGQFWTGLGSVAAAANCGSLRAARAPGVCVDLWYHHVLGIAPECAWDSLPADSDGDTIFDDGDASGTAGDTSCATGEWLACDDNCRLVVNEGQDDTDTDSQGNACDDDDDDDGLSDIVETDTGIYVSPSDTGSNPLDPDSDGDGFGDAAEVAAGSDPNDEESLPTSIPALDGRGLLLALALLLLFGRRRVRRSTWPG